MTSSTPPTPRTEESDPRPFLLGIAALSVSLAGLCLLVASREWFKNDDFALLAYAQRDDFSWLEVFLPMGEGRYWAYRPLGLEGFFRAGHLLFGANATSFFVVSLLARFAAAAALYRLARQLGFSAQGAALTALFSVSRPPSMTTIWWASGFNYIGAVLFGTLSLTWFMDALRGRGRGYLAASLAAFAAALLCHEVSGVFAGVAGTLALLESHRQGARLRDPATWLRAARSSAGHIALACAYVVLRSTQVGELPAGGDELYDLNLSAARISKHAAALLGHVFRSPTEQALWLLALTVSAALALASPVGRREARRWGAPVAVVGGLWALATLAPFSVLTFAHARYAIPLEVPVALLLGSVFELALRTVSAAQRRWLELVLLLTLAAGVPYASLWARAQDPGGGLGRQLGDALREHEPLPVDARVVLLYGTEGLATFQQARAFRRSTYGSAVMRVLYPEQKVALEYHHLEKQVAGLRLLCDRCLYLTLGPEMRIREAEPRFVAERLYATALASEDERIFRRSAQRLALSLGAEAAAPILTACEAPARGPSLEECFKTVVKSLRELGTRQGEAAALALIRGRIGS